MGQAGRGGQVIMFHGPGALKGTTDDWDKEKTLFTPRDKSTRGDSHGQRWKSHGQKGIVSVRGN